MARVSAGKFKKIPVAPKAKRIATREGWLKAVADKLRPIYGKAGVVVPHNIRYALSFTSTGKSMTGGSLGECWNNIASKDSFYEIIVRCDQDDPLWVAKVIAHELVHASVPLGAGHGPVFREAALAVGLEGKMTQALPGEALTKKLEEIVAKVGPLPHGALKFGGGIVMPPTKDGKAPAEPQGPTREGGPKPQKARLHKCECAECGYTVRVTNKWLEIGAPICPVKGHGAMEVV